jgi:hypothetical protein
VLALATGVEAGIENEGLGQYSRPQPPEQAGSALATRLRLDASSSTDPYQRQALTDLAAFVENTILDPGSMLELQGGLHAIAAALCIPYAP